MQIIFLSGTKCLWLAQYVNKFLVRHKKFGPAQNILGPVKGQGICCYLCVCGFWCVLVLNTEYILPKDWKANALSFYISQNVSCRSKFFVSDQKFIYKLCQSQTFCARQKDDLHSVKLVFVMAQKFLKRHKMQSNCGAVSKNLDRHKTFLDL
jgi:hypothetical protein